MTNSEILAAVSRAVNDATFTKRTKAIMLGIITDAQNRIIDKTECLRQIDSTSIALGADDGDYDMPASFVKFPTEGSDVQRAFVSLGTYGKFPLTFIPMTILSNRYSGWRQTASGTPEFYSLVEKGTPNLIIYPKPSSSFISTNGSTVFMDMIYRPTAALAEDSNLPFDNASRFTGLFQILLKLLVITQIKIEDMKFEDADKMMLVTDKLFEEAIDLVRSIAVAPGNHGFEEQQL